MLRDPGKAEAHSHRGTVLRRQQTDGEQTVDIQIIRKTCDYSTLSGFPSNLSTEN